MDNSYKVLGPRIRAAQAEDGLQKGNNGGAERASTWQPQCGWCHVALLCLFRLERLIKWFLLLQGMNLRQWGRQRRDVRLMCVYWDSGWHRGRRSTEGQW